MMAAMGLTLLIVGLLQVWRPLFFLTDDSLRLAWPVLIESGHARQAGGDPEVSQFLFGGGYDLRKDAMFTPNRHPLMVGLSWMAGTAWELTIIEWWAAVNLALAAGGFVWMAGILSGARWGKDAGRLSEAGPWLTIGLSLSYTFNGYTLLLGSSGYWYLANVAALPWMVGALWDRRPIRSVVVLVVGGWHMLVGGYPSCTVYAGLFLAVLVGVRWIGAGVDRWRILAQWSVAAMIGGGLAWLWLEPVVFALGDSVRGGPINLEAATEKAMPVLVFVVSFFASSFSIAAGDFEVFGQKSHAYAMAACPMAWFFWPALSGRRGWNGWDGVLGGLFAAGLLLISRPEWLAGLMMHVPILGSLRWPYKEVYLLLFTLHLWMLRGTTLLPRHTGMFLGVGLILFLVPLFWFGPPTLNAAESDRQWLRSGAAVRYWDDIKKELGPDSEVVPVLADRFLWDVDELLQVPAIAIGSHNYPAYFRVRSPSGYSATLPAAIFLREPRAATVYGTYDNRAGRILLERGATLLRIEALEPLRVVMETATGQQALSPPDGVSVTTSDRSEDRTRP
jgi:hypothetical protein